MKNIEKMSEEELVAFFEEKGFNVVYRPMVQFPLGYPEDKQDEMLYQEYSLKDAIIKLNSPYSV